MLFFACFSCSSIFLCDVKLATSWLKFLFVLSFFSTTAVLIDRGIGGIIVNGTALRVAVLFFSGPDDRESLALAGRMANHPAIEICVVRFMSMNANTSISSVNSENAEVRQRSMDDACLQEFVQRSTVSMIDYREHVVGNAEETVEVIRRVQSEGKDLLLVGKEQGSVGSRLTAGMTEWSEFPELGPIGDLLASADFGATASILIIQAPRRGSGLADSTIIGMPNRHEDSVKSSFDER